MNIGYPYGFDDRGRTAQATDAAHIRDLIEQVLFTMPGERVNRPDFGSGVMQLVFAANSDELAAASQFLIQGALQQWLSDRITIESVDVGNIDSTLRIVIVYTVLLTQEQGTVELVHPGAPP